MTWEYKPSSEADDPADEKKLAQLSEELRMVKYRQKPKVDPKRLFGYNVPWGGSDCSQCFFRGDPRYKENLGRCLILEAKGYHAHQKVLPHPTVSETCPYFVSLEEMVIRSSETNRKRLLMSNLRAKLNYRKKNNMPLRKLVDKEEEERNKESLEKQQYTRNLLVGLETIGWWNNMAIPIRKDVAKDIRDENKTYIPNKDWGYLDETKRKLVLEWKKKYFATRYKAFLEGAKHE